MKVPSSAWPFPSAASRRAVRVVKRLRMQLLTALTGLGAMVAAALMVYHYIEGWSWLDALYMVAITISTVGYDDHNPSPFAKAFTIAFIGYWLVVGALVVRLVTEYVVEELEFRSFTARKMQRSIEALKEHYIICGYGRMGSQIAREFQRAKVPFVVVESNPAKVEALLEAGLLFVEGDATQDEVLERAGIRQAKGLIAVADSDATNIFITLTARGLQPDLFIVARAAQEDAESKLLRAGANRVISPYVIGGRRIAAAVLTPTVVEFFDAILHSDEADLGIGEVALPPTCRWVGKSLQESGLREETGVIVIGLRRGQRFLTHLSADTVLQAGDVLIAIGTGEQIERLAHLIGA